RAAGISDSPAVPSPIFLFELTFRLSRASPVSLPLPVSPALPGFLPSSSSAFSRFHPELLACPATTQISPAATLPLLMRPSLAPDPPRLPLPSLRLHPA